MSTRLIKGGRPPVTRDAILAAIMDRPGEGITSARVVEIVGCTPTAACDGLRVLRAMGLVTWLRLDRQMLHFAPGPYRDLYAQAHQAGLSQEESTLAGVMETRRARVLEMLRMDLPLGLSAMELAAELAISAGTMRHLLQDMVRAGEAWSGGPARRVRWFRSREAALAAKPALDAMETTRKVVSAKSKAKGGQSTAERKPRAKPEPMPMRRDCGESVSRQTANRMATRAARANPAPVRQPVEIIGMETARRTEAVQYPDHRFWVDPDTTVPGGFREEFHRLRAGGGAS